MQRASDLDLNTYSWERWVPNFGCEILLFLCKVFNVIIEFLEFPLIVVSLFNWSSFVFYLSFWFHWSVLEVN
jgi:hypothetical protein